MRLIKKKASLSAIKANIINEWCECDRDSAELGLKVPYKCGLILEHAQSIESHIGNRPKNIFSKTFNTLDDG